MLKVCKVYRMGETEVHALRDVDLELLPGEFVVLLGASVSGKSTLLNILGGLDRPTSGEVHYLDHGLTAAPTAELTRFRRKHVGFVFQFYYLGRRGHYCRRHTASADQRAGQLGRGPTVLVSIGWKHDIGEPPWNR